MEKLAGDLMNDSDSDDQDYVPSGAESEDEDDAPAENDEIPDEDEEEKRKTAALWADFMADVEPVPKKARVEDKETAKSSTQSKDDAHVNAKHDDSSEAASSNSLAEAKTQKEAVAAGPKIEKGTTGDSCTSDTMKAASNTGSTGDSAGSSGASNKIKVTQVLDFAGEKIEVEKELDKDSKEAKRILAEQARKPDEKKVLVRPNAGGGLGTVVGGLLNKKSKMSILEKSKLDWNGFKRDEGIEEELANHNKGKDGYLEKMAFLDRTDLRQFDIEKSMRDRQRSARGGNM